tara:strand:+ start:4555 stop:4977 length:423 start_codon:yes stop_codon:yes gene_type:complete
MVNIIYNISEKTKHNDNNNIDTILQNLNNDIDSELSKRELNIPDIFDSSLYTNDLSDYSEYEPSILEIHYSTGYTVQDLGKIMEYYGLQKRKLKKDELIQTLVLFESDEINLSIVQHRRRLWDNIEELKSDPFFSKYILF